MSAEHLPFRRRIFASVDVIGSTSLKQGGQKEKQAWPEMFRQFFDDFPEYLEDNFAKIQNVPNGSPAKPMEVWKLVGDEILFQAELAKFQEAAFHVLAFMGALQDYAQDTRNSKESLEGFASLKGTIWGAGFPVSNSEVKPRSLPNSATDYIGPCIDQGFRLCSLSDTRKLTISVDIAYMISLTKIEGEPSMRLFCEEPKFHKGLSFHYPHIWIDRMNNTKFEDEILGRIPPKKSALTEYIEELYGKQHGSLFRPFIEGDADETFGKIPQEFIDARHQLVGAELDAGLLVEGPDLQGSFEDVGENAAAVVPEPPAADPAPSA